MTKFITKIILVDDDEDDRDMFAEALQCLNLHENLQVFKNGKEFLDYVDEIDRSIEAHLFLDLNMPEISGLEILKQVRGNLGLENLLVTIFSTSSAPIDIDSTYNLGANGYLKKPSSFKRLQELILKAIDSTSSGIQGKQTKENYFLDRS